MEQRKTDELILYKLDELKGDIGTVRDKLEDHIKKTDDVIHGNGKQGIKTSVEIIKTRMIIMWGRYIGSYGWRYQ